MKLIKTEADYEWALAQVETLMDAAPDSPEERALVGLTKMIHEYEQVHHPIDPPTPIEAIKFRLDQEDLQGKARLIAEAGGGGAKQIGDDVCIVCTSNPFGNIQVRAVGIAVHLYCVSPLLALRIAKLVRQEREEYLVDGEQGDCVVVDEATEMEE